MIAVQMLPQRCFVVALRGIDQVQWEVILLAAKVFQSLVYRIKEILDCDAGITDSNGMVIASTRSDEIGSFNEDVFDFINSGENYQEKEKMAFVKVNDHGALDFVAYTLGTGEARRKAMELISLSIENAKLYYEEKYDKTALLKTSF